MVACIVALAIAAVWRSLGSCRRLRIDCAAKVADPNASAALVVAVADKTTACCCCLVDLRIVVAAVDTGFGSGCCTYSTQAVVGARLRQGAGKTRYARRLREYSAADT